MALNLNDIYIGDSNSILKDIDDDSISLIMTSPPYADNRKKTYGGIPPDNYVDWFMPIAEQLYRVLSQDGSFILNIKEKVVDGERHSYVLELILALKKQGWLWTEEYIWHKRNCFPGKWPNRLRDGWERCLHFNKNKKFKMFQDEIKVPIGDWASDRLKNLSNNDKKRFDSKVGSGFGKNISNWCGKEFVLPSNVLHLPTECGNKNHSAVFPISLPTFFIKLFTQTNDIVLDPFAGSGTTLIASKNLNRNFIGIEILQQYKSIIHERLSNKTDN